MSPIPRALLPLKARPQTRLPLALNFETKKLVVIESGAVTIIEGGFQRMQLAAGPRSGTVVLLRVPLIGSADRDHPEGLIRAGSILLATQVNTSRS